MDLRACHTLHFELVVESYGQTKTSRPQAQGVKFARPRRKSSATTAAFAVRSVLPIAPTTVWRFPNPNPLRIQCCVFQYKAVAALHRGGSVHAKPSVSDLSTWRLQHLALVLSAPGGDGALIGQQPRIKCSAAATANQVLCDSNCGVRSACPPSSQTQRLAPIARVRICSHGRRAATGTMSDGGHGDGAAGRTRRACLARLSHGSVRHEERPTPTMTTARPMKVMIRI